MSLLTKLRRRDDTGDAMRGIEAEVDLATGAIPIAEVQYRQRAKVAGRVRSVRVQPWAGVATLECTVVDASGGLVVVFLGRREVAGVRCGSRLVAEGMVGVHDRKLAILNPDYEILTEPDAD
jgi:RecG-like helicase